MYCQSELFSLLIPVRTGNNLPYCICLLLKFRIQLAEDPVQ